MATSSFDEKIVVTDPNVIAMMKADLEGNYQPFMTEIYTDGACSSSDNTGGWATLVRRNFLPSTPSSPYPHSKTFTSCSDAYTVWYGCKQKTTNNEMELYAFRAGVYFAYKHIDGCCVIYTDSAYIANCFKDKWYLRWEKNGWQTSRKTPVEHRELWEEILRLYRLIGDRIDVSHIKGHSDITYNNYADMYAVAARKQLREHMAAQEKR